MAMGVSMTVLQPTGVSATYWRVSKLTIDNINFTINAVVSGYLDEATCNAGGAPMMCFYEFLDSIQFAAILSSSNIIVEFYTQLLTMSDFMSATLVLS